MGYIYKITNMVNGKIYIGQTIRNIDVRWKEHLKASDKFPIHMALRKYGHHSFKIEEVERCSDSDLDQREIFWISFFDSSNKDVGYNLTLGGAGGKKHDYTYIRSLWDSGMGTGEIADKTGIKQQTISTALTEHQNYSKCEAYSRGYAHARKTKGTPVSQYDIDGNYLNSFASSKDASMRVNGTTRQNIIRCCREKNGLSGGYQWRFTDDSPPERYTGLRNTRRTVAQYDTLGNLLCSYQSVADASRESDTDITSIFHCCNGRYKTANGFKWAYVS